MKLTEIVPDAAIIPQLEATNCDAVVAELIDALIAANAAEPDVREELIRAVLDRESKGSTGFGRGVAVPHVKHERVHKIAAAVGLSEQGVDFNALDKQPVYSIFLLLSPADRPEEHLQAMEVLFRNLSFDTFRKFLRQATTVEEVKTLLQEADNQQLTA